MLKYKVLSEEYDTEEDAEQSLEDWSLKGWSVLSIRVTTLSQGGIRLEAVLIHEE